MSRFCVPLFTTVISLFVSTSIFSQQSSRALTKRVILKSNVLSLVARQPTLSVEKPVSKTISAEVSYIKGQFNHILFTDHYDYQGFLLRAKKYFAPLQLGTLNFYAALYAGNLRRHIQTEGRSIANGYLGYPSRSFSSNSIRAGTSFGFCYFTTGRFVFDHQTSLGYGRYLKLDKSDSDTYSAGYPDIQVWFSIGYCF